MPDAALRALNVQRYALQMHGLEYGAREQRHALRMCKLTLRYALNMHSATRFKCIPWDTGIGRSAMR
eukprot:1612081-Pyramimonas_sp.AAC.1